MSENNEQKHIHSLHRFLTSISNCIDKFYNEKYWIKAEISKLNLYTKSGHCYPELIETQDGKQIANASGFIHKNDYQRIDQKFRETTGEPLHDGMVVLLLCTVHISTTRGLKLDISDIDINSVIGEQAQYKILTINKLKSDGVFALNKQKTLPRIVKHLAVISVETGKGYADFISIINNAQKIHVKTTLFNSMMMGETAVTEIQSSLHAIAARQKEFDAVCIIRGGGGDATLQCFNNYELTKAVATFPLPVLSGIGHATNDTVTEQVSLMSFVSPSELANYIIDYDITEVERFHKLTKKISDRLVFHKNIYVNNFKFPVENFKLKFKFAFGRKFNEIEAKKARIISLVHKNLAAKNQQLATTIANVMSEVRVPAAQTKITVEGKNIQGAKDLKRDDEISIFFNDGIVFAQVINIVKKGL